MNKLFVFANLLFAYFAHAGITVIPIVREESSNEKQYKIVDTSQDRFAHIQVKEIQFTDKKIRLISIFEDIYPWYTLFKKSRIVHSLEVDLTNQKIARIITAPCEKYSFFLTKPGVETWRCSSESTEINTDMQAIAYLHKINQFMHLRDAQ